MRVDKYNHSIDNNSLISYKNRIDINSMPIGEESTSFRKIFRKDFFKWVDTIYNLPSHTKNSIGQFIESHLDDFIIEVDSQQIKSGNGFNAILEKYCDRTGFRIN